MAFPARASRLVAGRLRAVWLAAAGTLLTLAFVIADFPEETLARFLEARLSRTGLRVAIESAAPSLHLVGLGITALGVRAAPPGGEALRFDRLVLRPGWSLSWLRGRPALWVELEGPLGGAEGLATLGPGGGFAGDLIGVDLRALPLASAWPGVALDGRADAALDLSQGLDGPEGFASFEAQAGSLTLPGFALAVPFETLTGDLQLGGETLLQVRSLALAGPMLKAEVSGSIGKAPEFQLAPLQLQIQLSAEPSVRSALASEGLRLGSDGSVRLRVTGTPGRPLAR
jgi:type II secretion system protein N